MSAACSTCQHVSTPRLLCQHLFKQHPCKQHPCQHLSTPRLLCQHLVACMQHVSKVPHRRQNNTASSNLTVLRYNAVLRYNTISQDRSKGCVTCMQDVSKVRHCHELFVVRSQVAAPCNRHLYTHTHTQTHTHTHTQTHTDTHTHTHTY